LKGKLQTSLPISIRWTKRPSPQRSKALRHPLQHTQLPQVILI
jgi:hypothetical protein